MEKRTVKIVVIISLVVIIIAVLGTVLGMVLLPQQHVELEVWPRSEFTVEPVIKFRAKDPDSWNVWFQRINDFLKPYETQTPEDPPRAPCSTDHTEQQARSEPCRDVMRSWSPCSADEFYGYRDGSPCVFLRLNHTRNWVPQPYNSSSSLPAELPDTIKDLMSQRPATRDYGDVVWLSCNGTSEADQANIGPVQYYPAKSHTGFPISSLLTANNAPRSSRHLPEQTLGPLIAVLFENPRRNVLINVECRAWTHDLYQDRSGRAGRVRFGIYVDMS